jgi:sulfonate transport system permease protein
MPERKRRWARFNWAGFAAFAGLAGVWELALDLGFAKYETLPTPSEITLGFTEILRNGQLAVDTLHTLRSVLAGWIIALSLGISGGLWLGLSGAARRYGLASIEVLRPIPGIAFVPPALLLFGFSLQMELMVIVLPALWPVLINTMGAVSSVHARLFEVGRTLRLPRATVVRKILIPAAVPGILVGARLSLTLALVLAIVAEMVGNPNGLGYAVVREQQALRPDLMFAYVGVIGALGVLLNAGLTGVASRFFPAAADRLHLEGR